MVICEHNSTLNAYHGNIRQGSFVFAHFEHTAKKDSLVLDVAHVDCHEVVDRLKLEIKRGNAKRYGSSHGLC